MWEEEDEEEKDSTEEEAVLEEGLDEDEAEALEGKAAAKKQVDDIDPDSMTVSAKESLRRKLDDDMKAFLRRGGAVKHIEADESKMGERETARAPEEDEEEA